MPGLTIVHLSQTDAQSGAGQAAYRIHRALLELNVRSSMVVADRRTSDGTVLAAANGPVSRSYARACAYLEARSGRRIGRPETGFLSPSRFSSYRPAADARVRVADIVCLYWINGGFIRPEGLTGLSQPVVWRLSDVWPFTGGCHYPGTCERFIGACGECPQTAGPSKRDSTARLWKRKRNAWQDLDMTVVAPSTWIADLARRSSLFAGRRIVVIPTGVDLDRYRPLDRDESRSRLGLPRDRMIILFGAMDPTADPRKGFSQLRSALDILAETPVGGGVTAVLFGGSKTDAPHLPVPAVALGRLDDDRSLALAYSAADIVVVPSIEDNLPNVALEAIACGTPVVGFDVCGMPDIVRHGWNGVLADHIDGRALAGAIERMLTDPARLASMAVNARSRAEECFSLRTQVQSYLDLYRELAARRSSASVR